MVLVTTSVGRSGLQDWLIQRVSAIVVALFVATVFVFVLMNPDLNFTTWQGFFAKPIVKVSGVLALFFTVLHAWIGIWTVTTDYIKCFVLRLTLQLAVILGLLACFIWGIAIIWSA